MNPSKESLPSNFHSEEGDAMETEKNEMAGSPDVSQEELDAAMAMLNSRQEYKKGDIPFEFDYQFPNSEARLKAYQDEEGIGHVVVTIENEIAYDVGKLLPEGYKMVTPAYFRIHEEEKSAKDSPDSWGWETDYERKFIHLGDFRSVLMIGAVLHEIGHARYDMPEEIANAVNDQREILSTFKTKDIEERKRLTREIAQFASLSERRASSYMLRSLRGMKNKLEISDPQISNPYLKELVTKGLASHRKFHEMGMRRNKDTEFEPDMDHLFDRDRTRQ